MNLNLKLEQFFKKPEVSKYLKNTSWLMSEQILRLLSGMVIGVWVARFLGPDKFGDLSYVIAFTSLFAGIAKLGLDNIIIKELVSHPQKRDEILGTSFWLKMAGGLLSICFIYFSTLLLTHSHQIDFLIIVLSFGVIFKSFEFAEFYFQSQVQAKYSSIAKLIQLTIISILKVLAILQTLSIKWFVVIVLFDQIILGITCLGLYIRKVDFKFISQFNFEFAKKILSISWPLILSALTSAIYMKVDQIMLKNLTSSHSVGVYSAAVKLSMIWYFIPTMIITSLYPAIIKWKNTDPSIYTQRYQALYNGLIQFSIAVGVFFSFFNEMIVEFVFGTSYFESSKILSIHIWSGLFVIAAILRGKWFILESLTKYSFYTVIIGASLNVALNIFLIPKYHSEGAAYATLISRFLSFYLIALFLKDIRITIHQFHLAIMSPLTLFRKILN